MKDLSSRAVSSYCPACLRAVVNAQCTVCGDLTITPVEQWETRVGSWTCDALIYHDSQEELYHVSRGQTGGLLRRSLKGTHIRLKDMDPLVGEIHPIDEGIHEGSAFMVWPWPACTAIAKSGLKPGKAVSVAKSLFDAALERLENGGTEPQPWEVVIVNTEWGLLAGWERVDIAHEMAGASLAAPERFRGGAPTDSTKVYLHAALIYLLASGCAPMGLLRPPSGNGVNVEPFDLAVAGGLCVRPDQRTRRENFIPELERSLGILSPGKKILQMAGAAMGIGLLLAIGYGLSALMASL